MIRAADVLLARDNDVVRAVAVDVSAAGVWRRLGLRRLAARADERVIDWRDIHLTSSRAHELQLTLPDAGMHRLGPTELAALVAHLPTAPAAEILGAVTPAAAAGALRASHPRTGARLLEAVPHRTASRVMELLAADDAAAVLRRLAPPVVDDLLATVVSERAATLRRLLTHPADTAGGLMTTDVRTARAGEPVEEIRRRMTANGPGRGGLAGVFFVDDGGRPVGALEPNDLLAGRSEPRPVPVVAVTLPVERVVDLFALHDHVTLPVVDTDGILVGGVTIDDVFEELVAERLPGHGRYAAVRRRPRRARRHGGR
jgi:Mg/Co/Ni transporter MgtE